MSQIIGSLASLCHRSRGRNFESNLMKICTVVWGRKIKIEFVTGENPMMSLFYPYFLPFLPLVIHVQWDGPNSKHCSIDNRQPILAVNTLHDAPWQPLGCVTEKLHIFL